LKNFEDKIIGNKGAVFNSINKDQIREIIIPYPKSLIIQKQIVKKLDKLSAHIRKLEENYQKQLNNLKELKKSFLKGAFDGEFKKIV
jgi:type I restriction enzyme S subunit